MKGKVSLVQEAARQMQALTGFDRVMIYRFHADGSGEVIAERVQGSLEPFLGLRYPAEDIPKQARALLLRNPVRILADVRATPVPLTPSLDGTSANLDLSMSTLRAHSTMHVEYLQNMGVGSTMTVSLVRDGRLWGLISCHHITARHVGFEQRTTAELFGEILSLMIEKQELAELIAYQVHTQQIQQRLVITGAEAGPVSHTVEQLAQDLADLVPCDGFAIYVRGKVTIHGQTPSVDDCERLKNFLDEHASNEIYATNELGREYAPAREFPQFAGLLVLPMSSLRQDYIVFFRYEEAHAVTWAGRPAKLLVVDPTGPRLSPRKSFAAWREVVRGHSAAWTPNELAAAEMIRITFLEVALQHAGATETESRATAQKHEVLIAELNHRVRNILGLIRGLVAQSRLSAQDVDTFATVLGDRVHALARAHDQITEKNWGPGSLRSLVATEAAAFLGNGAARVSLNGPETLLQPQAFSTLALVVHELMTNAAKYGALSGAFGQVVINWKFSVEGGLILDWHELGGPRVSEPTRRGFGSTIIQKSIPHELGGEATLDYATTGLHAQFLIPSPYAVLGEGPALEPATAKMVLPVGRLSGTVLLVEDNIIIALEAEDMLMALGADDVLVASDVAGALRLLASARPTFALLDINLGSESSWPIASHLRDLGVRYAFATGYNDGIAYPLEHRHAPVISKPYTKDTVAQVLSKI